MRVKRPQYGRDRCDDCMEKTCRPFRYENFRHPHIVFLVISIALSAVTILVGGAIWQALDPVDGEELSYLDGVYFVVETASSIGYGDLTPSNPDTLRASRAFICLFALISVPLVYLSASRLYDVYIARVRPHWLRLMRAIHFVPENPTPFRELLMTTILGGIVFVAVDFTMAGLYTAVEDFAFEEALYFSTITLVTVGFGDVSPVTPAGRALFCVFAWFGVVCHSFFITAMSNLAEHQVDAVANRMSSSKARLEANRDDVDDDVDDDRDDGV
jgi:voltage-gated potassium channel Kch